MSFDPQNPRGAPRPSDPPPTPPGAPKSGNYIPPQPVNPGPGLPRELLIGGAVIIVLLLILAAAFVLTTAHDGVSTPAPTSPLASQVAQTVAGSRNSGSVPSIVVPTGGPTFVPASAGSTPARGYDAFLVHVPGALRASCVAGQSSDRSILFSTQCTSSDGIVVTYNQYADSTSMDAAYQGVFAQQQIDPNSGSCEDHTTWPAESAYLVEEQPAGRRLCFDIQGSPTIAWTDERLTIYSSATGSDPVRLVQFWTNEAGPIQ